MFKDAACVYLLPGELYSSDTPMMVNTVLGSCISVTMFVRRIMYGLISHTMLPKYGTSYKTKKNFRYADCALGHMNDLLKMKGVSPQEVEVKVFGGSDMFTVSQGTETVGQKNINAVISMLEEMHYTIMAQDIGGQFTRKLYFSTETGTVYLRKISRLQGV